MPRLWRKTFEGAKYHVTCRGNARQAIFLAPPDWARFRQQLSHACACEGVILYAWVLMPNHYHLLVETPRGNLSAFMRRLNTAYAMYFRHKHGRPGHCFQGRYGAKLVANDDYLLRLTRYLHLNPVSGKKFHGTTPEEKWLYLKSYIWSSFLGSLSRREAEEGVSYAWLRLMNRRTLAECRRAYGMYMRECLAARDGVLAKDYGRSAYAIGDDAFVEDIEEELLDTPAPGLRRGDVVLPLIPRVDVAAALASACKTVRVELSEVQRRGARLGHIKAHVIDLVCRMPGITQRSLADYLQVSEHAIGKQRQRHGKQP